MIDLKVKPKVKWFKEGHVFHHIDNRRSVLGILQLKIKVFSESPTNKRSVRLRSKRLSEIRRAVLGSAGGARSTNSRCSC